jgi:hypothetical protein
MSRNDTNTFTAQLGESSEREIPILTTIPNPARSIGSSLTLIIDNVTRIVSRKYSDELERSLKSL